MSLADAPHVILAGGTGLVGRPLAKALLEQGCRVTVLSRNPSGAALPTGAEARPWDDLSSLLEGAAAVVNLAGEGIADRRWTAERKQRLEASRVETTRRLVAAMRACAVPPRALVNASAIGYYVPRDAAPVTEDGPAGTGFLARVCRAWEAEAFAAQALGVRVAVVRIGVVLAKEGGAFPKMVAPVRAFLGAPLGTGSQGLSWIHLEDLVALLREAALQPTWEGRFNGTAPEPVSQAAFTRALGHQLHRPILPVPGWLTGGALRLALGELAEELLLSGAFVQPARALALGYRFRFPTLAAALEDLL